MTIATVPMLMPRTLPFVDAGPGPVGEPIRFVLDWGRRYSMSVFNVGLACCAVEFVAATMSRPDILRLGVDPYAPGPREAELIVISGTVTDKMAPAIKRAYDEAPDPKYVVSFGACANCGGPYWDSYAVTKGIDQLIPVDVYVPGCPPRPESLLHGILKLQEKIARDHPDAASGMASADALTADSVRPPSS
jgi:NADH-quinone oxidoreductase subunit B